jgi:hypothetical protein
MAQKGAVHPFGRFWPIPGRGKPLENVGVTTPAESAMRTAAMHDCYGQDSQFQIKVIRN